MQLKNSAIFISGAASGMGAACAEHFKNLGSQLILLDRNADGLAAFGDSAQCVVADVRDESALREALAGAPALDAAVLCAGVLGAGRVVGKHGPYPLADFEQVVQVNLIGHFNTLRSVAHRMAQLAEAETTPRDRVIIQTASVAAYDGQLGQAAYAATKGAIVSMTLPIARELTRFGIRVMTIAPGVMDTPMMGALKPEQRQALEASVTGPKRLGEPAEYAALAEHIMQNAYLNGDVIRLDGALRMA